MRLEAVRAALGGRYLDIMITVVAVATLAELLGDGRRVPALVSAVWGLVLLARRRAPEIAIAASFASQLALAALLGWHEPAGPFGLFLLTFVVAGGLRPGRAAWLGWACGMAAAAVAEAPGSGGSVGDILVTCAFCSALFVMSLLVTRRTEAHRQMAQRARHAEADRERSAAEAAAAERARIAREMHDVVAHSLTVAVVQCVAAAAELDSGAAQPDSVRTRVRAAEDACHDALDELRRMLKVLRFGAEPLAPSPRLAELTDLAGAISAAGVHVELSLEGNLDGLPPGVELSCYRIVQEALTNTLKHSGAGAAQVSVAGEADEVRVRVDDDGRGAAGAAHLAGQGLIGLRERAAAYGGTVSAGPRPEGGYLVEAVLPRGGSPGVIRPLS
jgi:signal transduction histidine kinase